MIPTLLSQYCFIEKLTGFFNSYITLLSQSLLTLLESLTWIQLLYYFLQRCFGSCSSRSLFYSHESAIFEGWSSISKWFCLVSINMHFNFSQLIFLKRVLCQYSLQLSKNLIYCFKVFFVWCMHELVYQAHNKGDVSFPTNLLFLPLSTWMTLFMSPSLALTSIGVFDGLHPLIPVSLKRFKTYFRWDTMIIFLNLVTSIPRNYFNYPKSLISDSFAKFSFDLLVSSVSYHINIMSST